MVPIQGHAAFIISAISLIAVISLLAIGLRHEKSRPEDSTDDH